MTIETQEDQSAKPVVSEIGFEFLEKCEAIVLSISGPCIEFSGQDSDCLEFLEKEGYIKTFGIGLTGFIAPTNRMFSIAAAQSAAYNFLRG